MLTTLMLTLAVGPIDHNPLAEVRSAAPPAAAVRFNPMAVEPPIQEFRNSLTDGNKTVAIGWHVHRCAAGHEWSHPDTARGDRSAHTCPQCGQVEWMPSQRNVRIVSAPAPVVIRSNCPGGVCPR